MTKLIFLKNDYPIEIRNKIAKTHNNKHKRVVTVNFSQKPRSYDIRNSNKDAIFENSINFEIPNCVKWEDVIKQSSDKELYDDITKNDNYCSKIMSNNDYLVVNSYNITPTVIRIFEYISGALPRYENDGDIEFYRSIIHGIFFTGCAEHLFDTISFEKNLESCGFNFVDSMISTLKNCIPEYDWEYFWSYMEIADVCDYEYDWHCNKYFNEHKDIHDDEDTDDNMPELKKFSAEDEREDWYFAMRGSSSMFGHLADKYLTGELENDIGGEKSVGLSREKEFIEFIDKIVAYETGNFTFEMNIDVIAHVTIF